MISLPFRRTRRPATDIDALYGMIVAQARRPVFYTRDSVPDTVEGRLEMILMHLVLVTRALTRQPAALANQCRDASSPSVPQRSPVAQALFDRFCADMDGNLREMGIGDLSVPKHMQRVAGAFYGRAKAYDAALDEGDAHALQAAVARNIFSADDGHGTNALRLADYMRETEFLLTAIAPELIADARFSFPNVEMVSV